MYMLNFIMYVYFFKIHYNFLPCKMYRKKIYKELFNKNKKFKLKYN